MEGRRRKLKVSILKMMPGTTPHEIQENVTSHYSVVQEAARVESFSTPRFKFLDGMRGIAALYVIFFHIAFTIFKESETASLRPAEYWMRQLFSLGHYAVVLFIVLSGFSLMLPVALGTDNRLRGGFKGYVARRARRILPPYYAAVIISLGLIVCVPDLNQMRGTRWDVALPVWTYGNIVSHLLLVYNASPAWFQKIDPPLWSVAVEWQIYFVFALLLLPVYRRFGCAAATTAGVIGSLLPRLVFHGKYDYSQLHFLGLFAFGMASAVQFAAWSKHSEQGERRQFWNAALSVLGVLTAIVFLARAKWHGSHSYLLDVLMDWLPGAAGACLLAKLAEQEISAKAGLRSRLTMLLEAKWSVTLGFFSYSIYLIHDPIIAIVNLVLHATHSDGNRMEHFLLLMLLGTMSALAGAYAFHCAFERPFLRPQASKREAKAAPLPV